MRSLPDKGKPGPLSPSRHLFCSACGARLDHPPPVVCAECGVPHWRNAKPCAGGLVVRAGRLLLVRRARDPWKGRWDIPGGFCEPDEHPEATVVREVREETGLDVTVTGFIGIWLDRYDDPDAGDRETILGCYFDAVPTDERETARDPQEVVEIGWFSPDALPDEIAFPDHAWPVLREWRRRRDG